MYTLNGGFLVLLSNVRTTVFCRKIDLLELLQQEFKKIWGSWNEVKSKMEKTIQEINLYGCMWIIMMTIEIVRFYLSNDYFQHSKTG
jgi:hypothetical protein